MSTSTINYCDMLNYCSDEKDFISNFRSVCFCNFICLLDITIGDFSPQMILAVLITFWNPLCSQKSISGVNLTKLGIVICYSKGTCSASLTSVTKEKQTTYNVAKLNIIIENTM